MNKDDRDVDTIFHYTDATGLQGILESGSLWATAYYSTNDGSEFNYSLDLIEKIFIDELTENKKESGALEAMTCDELKTLAKELNKKFINVIANDINTRSLETYIACFTMPKKNDESYMNGKLSQWRGYCKDGGYAIGFSKEELEKIVLSNAKKRHTSVFMGPVDYDGEGKEIKHLRERYIKPWINHLGGLKKIDLDQIEFSLVCSIPEQADKNERMKIYAKEKLKMLTDFLVVALIQKNRSFNEESEYRIAIVQGREGEVHHFNRGDSIVPYVTDTISYITPSINKIIIGPCDRFKDRAKGLSSLLYRTGIDREKVDLTISQIPYQKS